ncbi:MAG: hypothetical protein ACREV6_06775 [Clostridium sp.]|uniref:hypothetical protein n=1 Tax=Clostridium sp. TaxID=1506 RepID=UPI003D6DA075
MREFTYDKKKFELENILFNYTAMFNSEKYSPFAYAEIQKTNASFPHIDDENFWEKLNGVFIENYNMDLKALEDYLTKSPGDADAFRRIHIFDFIREKYNDKRKK